MTVDPQRKPAMQKLLEHEARAWMSKGYCTPSKIEELRGILKPHRKPDGIEKLIDEMRTQWQRRKEWLT